MSRHRVRRGPDSEAIMTRHFEERERVKERMFRDREIKERRLQSHRSKIRSRVAKELQSSPYTVDLVAESDRIGEETHFRLKEELRRERTVAKRKRKVKNDIILMALAEESDLNALRQEKRAIMVEEKRLKALLDIERAKLRRKQDLMAAQRAEKQRYRAKLEHRRMIHNKTVEERMAREKAMLMDKLDVPPEPTYGIRVGAGVNP
eukprot:g5981.t1